MVIPKIFQKNMSYHDFFLFFIKIKLKINIIPLPYFFKKIHLTLKKSW
jgi:hypothetical protein